MTDEEGNRRDITAIKAALRRHSSQRQQGDIRVKKDSVVMSLGAAPSPPYRSNVVSHPHPCYPSILTLQALCRGAGGAVVPAAACGWCWRCGCRVGSGLQRQAGHQQRRQGPGRGCHPLPPTARARGRHPDPRTHPGRAVGSAWCWDPQPHAPRPPSTHSCVARRHKHAQHEGSQQRAADDPHDGEGALQGDPEVPRGLSIHQPCVMGAGAEQER